MAYTKDEAVKLIIKASEELVKSGLIVRTWGNISVRISDTQFMITPSGKGYEFLTESDIITVNLSDFSYEGEFLPSCDMDMHGNIYKNREDINFIIHTHQLYGTAYGSLGWDLSDYDDENKQLLGSKIACTSYEPSFSKKLSERVLETVTANPGCYGFFMKYHGVLCTGKDFEHAFSVAMSIEDICMQKVTGKLKFALEGKEGTEILVSDELKARFPDKKVMFVTSPAIVAISEKFLKLRPTIDDLAQIGGVNINCIDYDEDFESAVKKAVGKNNLTLVRKCGAIVIADTFQDCKAIGIVLDKNCTSLLFELILGPTHHAGYFQASKMRKTYVNKYSKLRNSARIESKTKADKTQPEKAHADKESIKNTEEDTEDKEKGVSDDRKGDES